MRYVFELAFNAVISAAEGQQLNLPVIHIYTFQQEAFNISLMNYCRKVS